MQIHGNARLLPRQRTLMCERVRHQGWTIEEVAEAFAVSTRTVYRWLARFDAGEAMTDRSSAPGKVPGRTPPQTEALIEQLRRLRWTSTKIAAELHMATSTVCAVLARLGLNRLSRLEPPEPPNRYCRRHPGELIHIDIKKLGRFDRPGLPAHRRQGGYRATYRAGWDYVHVAIDDTQPGRLHRDPRRRDRPHLRRVPPPSDRLVRHPGVIVQRIMTDNGTGYRSKVHAEAVADLEIRHLRTRPYRPRTNGKAERFIKTLQAEWAYAASYQNHQQRAEALEPWLAYYNCRRPHSALGHKTPASIIGTD